MAEKTRNKNQINEHINGYREFIKSTSIKPHKYYCVDIDGQSEEQARSLMEKLNCEVSWMCTNHKYPTFVLALRHDRIDAQGKVYPLPLEMWTKVLSANVSPRRFRSGPRGMFEKEHRNCGKAYHQIYPTPTTTGIQILDSDEEITPNESTTFTDESIQKSHSTSKPKKEEQNSDDWKIMILNGFAKIQEETTYLRERIDNIQDGVSFLATVMQEFLDQNFRCTQLMNQQPPTQSSRVQEWQTQGRLLPIPSENQAAKSGQALIRQNWTSPMYPPQIFGPNLRETIEYEEYPSLPVEDPRMHPSQLLLQRSALGYPELSHQIREHDSFSRWVPRNSPKISIDRDKSEVLQSRK